jgi:hypothetical protein
MYATIVRCDLRTITPSQARECAGRSLATRLSLLPGFVAFIALESEAGDITAVYLVEERMGLAAAERVIAQWQGEEAVESRGVRRLGAGEVIAQKGL